MTGAGDDPWGEVELDFLIVVAGEADSPFAQFAVQLDACLWGQNLPTMAVLKDGMPSLDDLPVLPFAVLTDDSETQTWARNNEIPLALWQELPTSGFGVQVDGDAEPAESFQSVDFAAAAWRMVDLMQSLARPDEFLIEPGVGEVGVTSLEHRRLEVVITAGYEVIERHVMDPEDRALLRAAIDTLQTQLRTSKPDRLIVGQALRRVAAFAGGLMTGVAANYLFSLLPHFHA